MKFVKTNKIFKSSRDQGYAIVWTCTHMCILIPSDYLFPQGSKTFMFKIIILYANI